MFGARHSAFSHSEFDTVVSFCNMNLPPVKLVSYFLFSQTATISTLDSSAKY